MPCSPPAGPVRRAGLVLAALVAFSAALLPAVPRAGAESTGAVLARPADPRLTRGLYVDPATRAAHPEPAFRTIVDTAQPMWLTDHLRTPKQATAATRAFVTAAERAHRTALLTVYRIPDRDCGAYSSPDDDVTDREYRRWVDGVAAGIDGGSPIVVLEPDALAQMGNPSCTGKGDRLALLDHATRVLTAAGAWVYLDAGHSDWRPAAEMAPLLVRAGVARARGFSTNVANTQADGAEAAYAKGLVAALKQRRVPGVHYVVDTSRNGAGRAGPAAGDFCNPPAARLGKAPRLVFDGAFDARLWVKRPGESDGPCHGGPDAGVFWADGACRLQGERGYAPATRRCR